MRIVVELRGGPQSDWVLHRVPNARSMRKAHVARLHGHPRKAPTASPSSMRCAVPRDGMISVRRVDRHADRDRASPRSVHRVLRPRFTEEDRLLEGHAMSHSSRIAPYLAEMQREIESIARGYGLDFFETIFEELDYKSMNEVAAYGGFPTRYPHWRYGMGVRAPVEVVRVRPLQDLRDGHQQRPLLRVPPRGQLARRPEDGHGPRLRAQRLLQEQLLLLAHQPPDDRRHGEPRHARAPPRRAHRDRQGGELRRRVPLARQPHRAALRVRAQAEGRDAPRRTTRRGASRMPRCRA